jgi:hypothetical protein
MIENNLSIPGISKIFDHFHSFILSAYSYYSNHSFLSYESILNFIQDFKLNLLNISIYDINCLFIYSKHLDIYYNNNERCYLNIDEFKEFIGRLAFKCKYNIHPINQLKGFFMHLSQYNIFKLKNKYSIEGERGIKMKMNKVNKIYMENILCMIRIVFFVFVFDLLI